MNKKLFVGRLPFGFSNEQLRALFISSGTVVNAVMVPDGKNGRTRGFGFVDMTTEAEAQTAIQSVNGTPLEDKKIWVTLAREKGEAKQPAPEERSRRPAGDRPSNGRRPFGNHFTDSAGSAPAGKPPFRGKRAFPGGNSRFSGPSAGNSAPSRPSGNRRPFRSADARPGGPPRARDSFRGPPKRAGGRRPPP